MTPQPGLSRTRAYRALLVLLPAHLRTRYGSEMESWFCEALADAQRRGRMATARAWVAAVGDVCHVAGRERLTRRRGRGQHGNERRQTMTMADVRAALRSVGRQRAATALAVGMLALGIAANTAVFTLVNGLFLRPFPFPQPERLAYLNERAPRWNLERTGINYPDFHRWRQDQRAFEAIALYDIDTFNFSDGRTAERIDGARVSPEMLAVLKIQPLAGRGFTEEETRPNGPRVVMIGEAMWRQRFNADPAVIGRTLRLESVPHTIVGVLPRQGEFFGGAKLWLPLVGDPADECCNYSWLGIGRLKPGITIEEAERDLLRAHQPIWDERDKERWVAPIVRDLRDEYVQGFRTAVLALQVSVALLLVIACANVASVMLARAVSRRREMGIRLALGASRFRLLRQLFIESAILAALGGTLGLVLGDAAIGGLLALVPEEVPRWAHFGLDERVTLFTAAACAVTALLFGWAPAFYALGGDLRSAIHGTSARTVSARGGRTLGWLVGAEFALAAVLLVGSGLLLRAYARVRVVDPGFRTENVLTLRLELPDAKYPEADDRLAFWDRLEERINALPGVRAMGLVTCPPMSGCHWGNFFDIEGRPPRGPDDPDPVVLMRMASAGYFEAMGIRLVDGRFFRPEDGRGGPEGRLFEFGEPRQGPPTPVVVNETFVRTFWPGMPNPVGRRLKFRGDVTEWMTVVGVAHDVQHYGLEEPMRPGVYFPLTEFPDDGVAVVIHTAVEPMSLAPAVRRVVQELDPELPLFRVETAEGAIRKSLQLRTAYSWLLGVFASLAALLALGGGYGVTAYLANQRTREMGIRVALGARTPHIVRAVLGGSLVAVGAGVLVGVGASLGLGRLLSSLLFGVSALDAAVLVSVVLLLLAAAAVANYWPARRAAHVDPASLLRAE